MFYFVSFGYLIEKLLSLTKLLPMYVSTFWWVCDDASAVMLLVPATSTMARVLSKGPWWSTPDTVKFLRLHLMTSNDHTFFAANIIIAQPTSSSCRAAGLCCVARNHGIIYGSTILRWHNCNRKPGGSACVFYCPWWWHPCCGTLCQAPRHSLGPEPCSYAPGLIAAVCHPDGLVNQWLFAIVFFGIYTHTGTRRAKFVAGQTVVGFIFYLCHRIHFIGFLHDHCLWIIVLVFQNSTGPWFGQFFFVLLGCHIQHSRKRFGVFFVLLDLFWIGFYSVLVYPLIGATAQIIGGASVYHVLFVLSKVDTNYDFGIQVFVYPASGNSILKQRPQPTCKKSFVCSELEWMVASTVGHLKLILWRQ